MEVVGPKELAGEVLRRVQELGVLHVEASSAEPLGLSPEEEAERGLLRSMRAKIASLEGVLGEVAPGEPVEEDVGELARRLEEIEKRVG